MRVAILGASGMIGTALCGSLTSKGGGTLARMLPRFRKGLGGPLADDVLSSWRLAPNRLRHAGFEFEHPDARSVVAAALR